MPSNIKQNKGGVKRTRDQDRLDNHPFILIYGASADSPFGDFLDGFSILAEDKAYREAAWKASNKTEKCDRFFLQMKQTYNTKVRRRLSRVTGAVA